MGMGLTICGEAVTDEQYTALLDIMTRNNYQQLIKEQVVHFKKAGWFAMNKSWYNTSGSISILKGRSP
jgi:hypothetical protein